MWPENLYLRQVSGSAGEFFFGGGLHFENHFEELRSFSSHWFPDAVLYLIFLPCCKYSVVFKNDHFKEFGA